MDTAEILTRKNTKPTSMRILVYNTLQKQNSAISLTEIESLLEKTDRVTIYRTLKTFEEKGIVHSIQDAHSTRYILCEDQCTEHTHHDFHLHFHCRVCNTITCQQTFAIPQIPDFQIEDMQLIAKGICKQCLAKTLQ